MRWVHCACHMEQRDNSTYQLVPLNPSITTTKQLSQCCKLAFALNCGPIGHYQDMPHLVVHMQTCSFMHPLSQWPLHAYVNIYKRAVLLPGKAQIPLDWTWSPTKKSETRSGTRSFTSPRLVKNLLETNKCPPAGHRPGCKPPKSPWH